jgi:methylated-DNA-[protein]-cysteine S-methyltransferase
MLIANKAESAQLHQTASTSSTFGDTILHVDAIETPLGKIVLAARNGKLVMLEFEDTGRVDLDRFINENGVKETGDPYGFSEAIRNYFAGRADAICALPVEVEGTPFQQKVWLALRDIPFGSTVSYGQLAAKIGSPNGSRAVGITNGRNRIALVLPCHRVVGGDGSLTGYAGGLARKEWLIRHEQHVAQAKFM